MFARPKRRDLKILFIDSLHKQSAVQMQFVAHSECEVFPVARKPTLVPLVERCLRTACRRDTDRMSPDIYLSSHLTRETLIRLQPGRASCSVAVQYTQFPEGRYKPG